MHGKKLGQTKGPTMNPAGKAMPAKAKATFAKKPPAKAPAAKAKRPAY